MAAAGPSSRLVEWRHGMTRAGGRRLARATWGSTRPPGRDCDGASQRPGQAQGGGDGGGLLFHFFPSVVPFPPRMAAPTGPAWAAPGPGLADPVFWWPDLSPPGQGAAPAVTRQWTKKRVFHAKQR